MSSLALMGFFFIDPVYVVMVLIPGLVIAGGASLLVKSRFAKYSRRMTRSGMTGAQAAQIVMDRAGISDVTIEQSRGFLSDHYDPRTKILRLSHENYVGRSVAAVSVAAHEAGHAIQHAKGYAPLSLRSSLVPLAGFGSNIGYFVMLIGLIMQVSGVVLIGAGLFSLVLLFQVVTLPVEFDASSRAKVELENAGIIALDEREGVSKVLNAAALTYVAAVVNTLLLLLYFLMRSGLLNSDD